MTVAATSIEAFRTTETLPIRELVHEIIKNYGADGCITDDVIAFFKKSEKTNTGRITGRFSELEAEGKIFRAGDTRKGVSGKSQLVMRDISYSSITPKIPSTKRPMSGFDKGVIYCAKMIAKASDLKEAKKMLLTELEKIKDKT
jgi:hypothetical protein